MSLEFNKKPLSPSLLSSQGVSSELSALEQILMTLALLWKDIWQGSLLRVQSGTVRFIDW